MRANKKSNTRPELIVRKLLFGLGYRYRLHDRNLPGRPDIVFRKRRKVIFVHGCFWHQHSDKRCHLRSRPKSNLHYWQPKLRRNVTRDRNNTKQLASLGWNILVVWECELREVNNLETELHYFLGPLRKSPPH